MLSPMRYGTANAVIAAPMTEIYPSASRRLCFLRMSLMMRIMVGMSAL